MDIQELAVQYGKAWAKHDLDAVMALHTEDTIFHVHGDNGAAATGSAAVREAIGAVLARSPDLRFERRRVYFGEAHFVSEYVMSGTVDGKPFACDGVDVIVVRDGRVSRKDTYVDSLVYARQSGLPLAASDAP
jgi:ketosteroid isomerase-like protein